MFSNNLDKIIDVLNKLRAIGIKIGIDDFGTGFSSLSYLGRLPVDYLKIDKSFVDVIDKDNELVTTVISIANTLNLATIAEGVETGKQLNTLINKGCKQIQGYYFSKPLAFADFIEYVVNLQAEGE